MAHVNVFPRPRVCNPSQLTQSRTQIACGVSSSSFTPKRPVPQVLPLSSNSPPNPTTANTSIPTMDEIMNASKSQNINLQLKTLGPFFRITATSLETNNVLGKAEVIIRVWWSGKVLHLDSIKLQRETLTMEKSIYGIGVFIGAVAIRYGYDCGCKVAELLAINDSDLYHSKLVRFYTRIGFKAVHEVTGSSVADTVHMLVWGGYGTRMNADVEQLLIKWGRRFKGQ